MNNSPEALDQPVSATDRAAILAAFRCRQTGACCQVGGGFVYVSLVEAAALAQQLGLATPDFLAKYATRDNGWWIISSDAHRPRCFLNEDNRCTVYAARPQKCRTYPDWPEIWESWEALTHESQACEGLASALQQIKPARASTVFVRVEPEN